MANGHLPPGEFSRFLDEERRKKAAQLLLLMQNAPPNERMRMERELAALKGPQPDIGGRPQGGPMIPNPDPRSGPGFLDMLAAISGEIATGVGKAASVIPPALGAVARYAMPKVGDPAREQQEATRAFLKGLGYGAVGGPIMESVRGSPEALRNMKTYFTGTPEEKRERVLAQERERMSPENVARLKELENPLNALFFAAPPGTMALGGISKGIQEAKSALGAGKKAVTGTAEAAKGYVGRAIETGGVSAGIPEPAAQTLARAGKQAPRGRAGKLPTEPVRPAAPPGVEPPIAQAATLPRDLAGAKPRYNIGQKSYQPVFASDLDKSLFIISQPKRSIRDADYLRFAQAQLPGVPEATLRNGVIRQHIKNTVSGKPPGPVDIPAFATKPIQAEMPVVPSFPGRTRVAENVTLYRGEPVGVRPQMEGMTGRDIPFSSHRSVAENFAGKSGRVVEIEVTPEQLAGFGKQTHTDLGTIDYYVPQDVYNTARSSPTAAQVAKGGVPPRRPLPPTAEGVPPVEPAAPLPPSGQGIKQTLTQADAIVQRDKPGLITHILDTTPGTKQALRHFVPARELPDNILGAHVGEGLAGGIVESTLNLETRTALARLEGAFGKGSTSTRGFKPVGITFRGTAAERAANATGDYTGTLADIIERPVFYGLTPAQRTVIAESQAAKDVVFDQVVGSYNLKIGKSPLQEGGMHVPHRDISEESLAINDLPGILGRGSTKQRVHPTMADRLHSDPKYTPETNVSALLLSSDDELSRVAGRNVFLSGAGGKTKMEVMKELHPELAAQMEGLQKRLASVKAAADRMGSKQGEAIDDFLASPMGPEDLNALELGLNPTVGANAVGRQGVNFGKDLKMLRAEVAVAKKDLVALRPYWNSAFLRGYSRIQEAGNLLFKGEEVGQIRRLLKRSDSAFLRFMDNLRQTAFGGDFSPWSIQGSVAWLSDPVTVSRFIAEGKGGFTRAAMLKFVRENPDIARRFTAGTGINPLGGVEAEFGTGFIGKIPKIGKKWDEFNEAVYRPMTKLQMEFFEDSYRGALKLGRTEEQAIAIAADDSTKIIPRINYRRLGQSQAQAALHRSTLTSVSFLTQPAAMMVDAAKGFIKLGTKQTVNPTEVFAMKRVATLTVMAEAIAVGSAVFYAKTHNQDVGQAIKDALNPSSGKFMTLTLPWGARIGIGGPFRSIIRAVWPREMPGSHGVPVPFAGIYRFGLSKIGPGYRQGIDFFTNRDYYGKAIRTEDFPVNILQGLAYHGLGVMPLTPGTAGRYLLAGKGVGAAGQEAVSQALGTNYAPLDKIWDAKIRWDKDFEEYRDIPSTSAERVFKLAAAKTPEEKARYAVSRETYRANHPEVDAKLFILGEVTSFESDLAQRIAVRFMRENNLSVKDIKGLEVKEYESEARTKLRREIQRALGLPSPSIATTQSGAPVFPWPTGVPIGAP